jgi:hypothetical protein
LGYKLKRKIGNCECGDHSWAFLTQGYVTIVSPEDARLLTERNWFALSPTKANYPGLVYAASTRGQLLHRLILGLERGQLSSHENKNGLDNRRGNINGGTSRQNQRASGCRRYRGIYARGNRWHVCISIKGKNKFLGAYDSQEEAAQAYDKAAIIHFGIKAAQLNFPVQASAG